MSGTGAAGSGPKRQALHTQLRALRERAEWDRKTPSASVAQNSLQRAVRGTGVQGAEQFAEHWVSGWAPPLGEAEKFVVPNEDEVMLAVVAVWSHWAGECALTAEGTLDPRWRRMNEAFWIAKLADAREELDDDGARLPGHEGSLDTGPIETPWSGSSGVRNEIRGGNFYGSVFMGRDVGIAPNAAFVHGGGGRGDRFPPPPRAPKLPEWVVDREQVDEVVHLLCPRGPWWRGRRHRPVRGSTVGLTTAVHGAGGFGKTTLADLVRTDPRVRSAFGGRVYAVTVGRDVRSREAVAGAAHRAALLFDRAAPAEADPVRAGEVLAEVLERAGPVLLVIDDVWEAEQLAPFLVGAPECLRMVTTRRPSALPAGHRPVLVDRMTEGQARAVLTHGGLVLPASEVDRLVVATGRWALLLRLANRNLARQAATGADVGAAARRLLQRLEAQGPADLDRGGDRSASVRASIEASTALLPPGGPRRFLELGVFAEDELVPVPVAAALWRATAGLAEDQARELCAAMADLSLLSLDPAVPGGALSLHDVVRDHLRATARDDLPALNANLLDALATDLPKAPTATGAGLQVPAWWQTSHGYLLDHLVGHLLDASRAEAAEALAGDLRWVRTRLH
ncbi:NB-ARC domain-containing protein [Streptomyces sp. NPDC059445]|uniref:NB-ARC domain-containing protein n=1 Tax=Streptomyces sp. NPDC059445 TaxID=3346832 RepID=UPI0036C5DDFF